MVGIWGCSGGHPGMQYWGSEGAVVGILGVQWWRLGVQWWCFGFWQHHVSQGAVSFPITSIRTLKFP